MPVENEHVSCRALGFHRKVAEHIGMPITTLLEGTGIDASLVDGRGYLSWACFAASLERLETVVGGRSALVELARFVNRPGTLPEYARILGQMVDMRVLADAAGRWAGPRLFPCLQLRLTWLTRRRMLYEIQIPGELEGCEPFLAVGTTGMRTLPTWLGLPDAEGSEVIDHDRRAWADLTFPERPSLRVRLRSRLRSLTSGKRLVDELVAQNEELREQKAALVDAKREAEEQRRRAEHASQMKSNFVAAVSHEMRTPMNALIIATQLLSASRLNASQREHADVVLRASRHMTRVLEDLIDLEGIEAGRLRLEEGPFAPRMVADEVIGMLASDAEARGLSLVHETADDVPALVVGDAARLRQVLLNLIGNALRYTVAGGVSLRMNVVEQGLIRMEVTDTGPGLDDDERARLFQPFVQGKAKASPRGAGLGLAIARRLVERMGGQIGVFSEPGRGSTFWCELPLERAASAAVSTQASRDADTSDAGAARLDVLLVEDDELTRKVFLLLLESLGCAVDTAEDGARAIAMCAEKGYDLVLMDCQMPVMGGLEATRVIRERGGPNQKTSIVGLTAGTRESEPALWQAAGMTNLLRKPLDVDVLRALLGSLPRRALPVS